MQRTAPTGSARGRRTRLDPLAPMATTTRIDGAQRAAASLHVQTAASLDAGAVVARLGSTPTRLAAAEAEHRLAQVGPNALRSHGARPLAVLADQLRNPLLLLLIGTALVGKIRFYRLRSGPAPVARRDARRRLLDRASRWSIPGRITRRRITQDA